MSAALDVAGVLGANGRIAQRLKNESPYKATMLATLTNGSARSGYIPDDASFGKYTFEVLSSRLHDVFSGITTDVRLYSMSTGDSETN